MVFKKWIYFFLIGIVVNLVILGGFNYFINPTGVFPVKDIEGINKIKNHPLKDDKILKFYYCRRANPNVLMMGNSTTGALNPQDLQKYVSGNIYNMAMHGASIFEEFHYIKYFVNNYDIKTILLGINLILFDIDQEFITSTGFSINRLERFYIKDYVDSLYSLDGLVKSYDTLTENRSGHVPPNLDLYTGMDTWLASYAVLDKDGPRSINAMFDEFLSDFAADRLKGIFKNRKYQDPHSIDEALSYFKKIVELCKRKNIALKVYISPVHPVYMDALYARNLGNTLEYFKKQVTHLIPVYDFSLQGSVTNDLSNYWDPSHTQQKIGKLIFARIFNDRSVAVPDDFGVLLTENNIDEYLLKQRNQIHEIRNFKNIY